MNKMFSISEAASLAIHSLAIIAKSKDQINVSGIAEATNFSNALSQGSSALVETQLHQL